MVSDICAEAKILGCKLMAPKIWGIADTMCNKAGAMSKMFCLVAKNKFMEDHTVGQMCGKIEFFGQKVLNITIPDSVGESCPNVPSPEQRRAYEPGDRGLSAVS